MDIKHNCLTCRHYHTLDKKTKVCVIDSNINYLKNYDVTIEGCAGWEPKPDKKEGKKND